MAELVSTAAMSSARLARVGVTKRAAVIEGGMRFGGGHRCTSARSAAAAVHTDARLVRTSGRSPTMSDPIPRVSRAIGQRDIVDLCLWGGQV